MIKLHVYGRKLGKYKNASRESHLIYSSALQQSYFDIFYYHNECYSENGS